MATALTHSFTRKADLPLSAAGAQQFDEPWDIYPDPKDPLEKHNDEGHAEFGVFGPMPSNPAKRARYLLLANYLELVGSGSTIGGASEREKREEEQHFERSVYAYTLQQVNEQITAIDHRVRHIDFQLDAIDKEIRNHRNNLANLRRDHAETQEKIGQLKQNTATGAAVIENTGAAMKKDDDQHAEDKGAIDEKIRAAKAVYDEKQEAFLKKFGLEYDPKTHRYSEIREDGTRREISIFSRPDIMGSRAYLEMYGAKMDVIALRQEAEQLESSHKGRHKLYERILTAQGDALTRNIEEINKLRIVAQQQEEAIAREEQRLLELEKTKQDLTEERRQLEQKKAELLEVRQKLDEMQDNNLMMRENLKKTSAIRETSHASRLALFANDPEKLAHENEIYAKYQTAYAGVCSIGDQPLSGITAGFNELQKAPGAKPDAGPDAQAVAAADPVNGDTAPGADPAKPAGQQVADASADQPKKAPVNANSGMT